MTEPIPGPDLDELCLAYLERCEQVQHEPANTVRARRRVLRSLPNAGTATREDLDAWWARRADHAPATRVSELALLRSFYRWAVAFEHRLDDPTVRLTAPRVPARRPRPASWADVGKLLADQSLAAELKRAIVLGAMVGMRRAEIAAADWADVDPGAGLIRVIGKGDKERLVTVDAGTLDRLAPRRDAGNIVRPGRPYAPEVLGRRLNRALAARGVHATCHQLRHLYGTNAYEKTGGDLLLVKELMGHANVQTTAGYARPTGGKARTLAAEIASAVQLEAGPGAPVAELAEAHQPDTAVS